METIRKTNKTDNPLPIYRIYWAETKTEVRGIRGRNIRKQEYNGKVWCLEVPTGILITRRNGKIGIHSNSGKVLQLTNEVEQIENELIDGLGLTKAVLSGEGPTYSNAQVAIEILIKRLESVRNLISYWIEEKVFKPISEFNGFTHKNRRGETEFIVPTVRWEDLKLRDNSQKIQYMFQARQSGDLSARTLLEKGLDIDLDNEIENMRLENMSEMYASPGLGLGTGGVDGGGYGGGGPAMPPGMDMMGGGGMPPDMGMDMGGGMPPDAGGMPPEGGASGVQAPTANILYDNYMKVFSDIKSITSGNARYASLNNVLYNDKNIGFGVYGILPEEPDFMALADITPRWGFPGCYASLLSQKNGTSDQNIRQAGLMGNMKNKNQGNKFDNSTKLEYQLHQAIIKSGVPSSYFMQYAINGDRRFVVDGAFPDLKIAVEADGKTWHIDQEKIQKDQYRDTQLASQGWMVLRFTEDEVEEQIQDVIALIHKAIGIRNQNKNQTKTVAEVAGEMRKIAEKIRGDESHEQEL